MGIACIAFGAVERQERKGKVKKGGKRVLSGNIDWFSFQHEAEDTTLSCYSAGFISMLRCATKHGCL